MTKHVAIIGNGIAGITAARFIRKMSDYRITVISTESDHLYSRPALMYIYMGHMTYKDTKPYEDGFWAKNRVNLVRDYVEDIDTEGKWLHLRALPPISYDVLLIATGSASNKFGWPGQDLAGVQGLYGLQDLEQMEASTPGIDRAVVVGGGLIGIEMAEMLHTRQIPVTFLVREQGYMDYILPPEEAEMVNREIREHHVDLRLATELKEILPDENGHVRAVVTKTGEEIACQYVGLTVGVHPNIEVVKNTNIETNRGVLVDEYFETNIPDVYAAGDCAEFRDPAQGHQRVEQLWYTGRRHGKTVAQTIGGRRTPYDKGTFFNSAKFFTIEYQTYGTIHPQLGQEEATVFWQHPGGKKLIRINYSTKDRRVLGFNLFGIRYRHEVCERWIRERRSIAFVLENLREANFDPEFFKRFEAKVVGVYNQQNPGQYIKLEKRRRLSSLFSR